MKRILAVMLVIVVIASMSVPAFATDDYVLSGVWTFNDVLTAPSSNIIHEGGPFVSVGTTFGYGIRYANGSANPTDDNKLGYSRGTKVSYVYDFSTNSWLYPEHKIIEYVEPTTVSSDFYNWFIANATQPTCDGSSCPATDVNIDGICDDCGMMLMSLSRTPVPPVVDGSNLNDCLHYSGSEYKYTAFTSETSYTIEGSIYGSSYRVDTSPAVVVNQYTSYDGINWSLSDTRTVSSYFPGVTTDELIDSSFNWYDENGELFFPLPLWVEMEQVTQGEMMGITDKTVGTMKILVACGVGLMACLVVLSLFCRRLLIFRS